MRRVVTGSNPEPIFMYKIATTIFDQNQARVFFDLYIYKEDSESKASPFYLYICIFLYLCICVFEYLCICVFVYLSI